jgi:hypothetical protein
MTEQTPEEIFKMLTASRILVAILEDQKQISISADSFINMVAQDKQLQVDYDDETNRFTFKIKEDTNEQ